MLVPQACGHIIAIALVLLDLFYYGLLHRGVGEVIWRLPGDLWGELRTVVPVVASIVIGGVISLSAASSTSSLVFSASSWHPCVFLLYFNCMVVDGDTSIDVLNFSGLILVNGYRFL